MPLLMCPNCNASMTEVKRNDVAFDMCPTCRGVWLDRGELEKIIAGVHGADAGPDRQAQQQRAQPQQGYGERREREERSERGYDDERRYDDRNSHGRRRRGGFDLFDIFD